MRGFQQRAAAHRQTRRDAGDNGLLARADRGLFPGGIAVCLQVHHTDKPLPHQAVLQSALNIDIPVHPPRQQAFVICLHGRADLCQARRFFRRTKIRFGQYNVQRAGLVGGTGFGPLPVSRL